MDHKTLTKSSTDKKVAGVAGGIAEYFEVDSTLVRIAFVLFTFAGGPGLLVYILLALVLKSDNAVSDHDYEFEKEKRKNDVAA